MMKLIKTSITTLRQYCFVVLWFLEPRRDYKMLLYLIQTSNK